MITQPYIGQMTTIVAANNISLQGLSGLVIDETQHSFLLQTTKGRKRVLKSHATFNFQNKEVVGKQLCKRPEDRMK